MTWWSVGAYVGSSFLSSRSSSKAADAQRGASQAAVGEQRRQYDQTREDFSRYREIGGFGLNTLADYLGLSGGTINGQAVNQPVSPNQQDFMKTTTGPRRVIGQQYGTDIWGGGEQNTTFDQAGWEAALAKYNQDLQAYQAQQQTARSQQDGTFGSLLADFEFEKDPGYGFRQAEGEKAVLRRASTLGNRYSPVTMKALQRFNQGLASDEYSAAFNRDQVTKGNRFNKLSTIAGLGNSATAQTAQSGSVTASNIGNYLTQGGNAQAAGIVGSQNAINSGIQNAGNAIQNQYWMNQFLNNRSSQPAQQATGPFGYNYGN